MSAFTSPASPASSDVTVASSSSNSPSQDLSGFDTSTPINKPLSLHLDSPAASKNLKRLGRTTPLSENVSPAAKKRHLLSYTRSKYDPDEGVGEFSDGRGKGLEPLPLRTGGKKSRKNRRKTKKRRKSKRKRRKVKKSVNSRRK